MSRRLIRVGKGFALKTPLTAAFAAAAFLAAGGGALAGPTPVDLSRQHLAPVRIVSLATLDAVLVGYPYRYRVACERVRLSARDCDEFESDVSDGSDRVTYAALPRRIDAMSYRHADGRIAALRNVAVPASTMGYVVPLRDRTLVVVPAACGNLSVVFPRRRVAVAPKPRNVSYRGYFPPIVAALPPPTPVVIEAPPVADVVTAPAPEAPAAPATHRSALPFLGLLAPLIASHISTGGATQVPPCSAGSNAFGACRP